jgi:hypothetical protein
MDLKFSEMAARICDRINQKSPRQPASHLLEWTVDGLPVAVQVGGRPWLEMPGQGPTGDRHQVDLLGFTERLGRFQVDRHRGDEIN